MAFCHNGQNRMSRPRLVAGASPSSRLEIAANSCWACAGVTPGLSRIGFNPAHAAIFELISAGLEDVLHRNRHPEVHAPADKSAVKALGCNADDGVHDTVKALRFADDLRIAM